MRGFRGVTDRCGVLDGVFLIEVICRDNKKILLFKISFPGLLFA